MVETDEADVCGNVLAKCLLSSTRPDGSAAFYLMRTDDFHSALARLIRAASHANSQARSEDPWAC